MKIEIVSDISRSPLSKIEKPQEISRTNQIRKISFLIIVIMNLCSIAWPLTFTDVADSAGITVPWGTGDACIFFDANNDSFPDLLFNPTGNECYFFINNKDGTFTDITLQSGFTGDVMSLVSGDFNNDSFLDILALNHSSSDPPLLFLNNGDTSFTEVGSASGLTIGGNRALFIDYNCDGFLDVLIIGTDSTRLYESNNGTNFTRAYTFPVEGKSGVAGDYDKDGYPDIYIVRIDENKLYRNNGNETFTDVTDTAGVGDTHQSEGAVWGDFDNDLDIDLYVTNNPNAFCPVLQYHNTFYRNNGNGTFNDVTAAFGVGDVGDGRTCKWIDYDDDGDLDIFATNHIYSNRLFRNNGPSAPFMNVANGVNIAGPSDIFAASWADYDLDGDLDVFIVGHNGYSLKRNDGGNDLHWFEVRLIGVQSNYAGTGAKIFVFTPDGRAQLREVSGGEGQQCHNSLIQHFGLGNNAIIDSLLVMWPNGPGNRLCAINTDTFITIIQGITDIAEKVSISPDKDDIWIDLTGTLHVPGHAGGVQIVLFDVLGRQILSKTIGETRERLDLRKICPGKGVIFIKITGRTIDKSLKTVFY